MREWPEHRAAPDFADRVMAAIGAPPPPPRARSNRGIVVAFALTFVFVLRLSVAEP